MKQTLTLLVAVVVLNYGNVACGWSPAFNHVDANQVGKDLDTANVQNVPGCDLYFATQNLCATLNWEQEPVAESTYGSFTLHFWNRDQGAAQVPVFVNPDAASVAVVPRMSAMGHGTSPVTVRQVKNSTGDSMDGEFEATQVWLSMSGKWDINVQLKDASNKVIDTAKIYYQAK